MNKPSSKITSASNQITSGTGAVVPGNDYSTVSINIFQNPPFGTVVDFWRKASTVSSPYDEHLIYLTGSSFDNPIAVNFQNVGQKVIEGYEETIFQLKSEVEELRALLSNHILSIKGENQPIVSENQHLVSDSNPLTQEQIRNYILESVKIGQVFYPSDIADKLGIDIVSTMEVINDLKKEGKLDNLKK